MTLKQLKKGQYSQIFIILFFTFQSLNDFLCFFDVELSGWILEIVMLLKDYQRMAVIMGL